MGLILDTVENQLGFTDADKATVNPALPTIAVWVKMLNEQWGTLQNAVAWLTASKAIATRLIADGVTLGPIVEDVLTGGGSIFEAGTALNAINDIKAVINANPKLIAALADDYKKLTPLITQIESDLQKPEIQAAVKVLLSKIG